MSNIFESLQYQYKAHVVRIIDGDTFDVVIDFGMNISQKVRLRLAHFDTPETYSPKSEAEKEHGKQATEFVTRAILGRDVLLNTYRDKTGKYGRYIAEITTPEGDDLGTLLEKNDLLKRESY